MIAEYFALTIDTESGKLEGNIECDNKIGYSLVSKSIQPLFIEAQSIFNGNNITISTTGKTLFDKSMQYPSIFLNRKQIGTLSIDRKTIKKDAMCEASIEGMEPIQAYDIGVGERFIFFRSNNESIGCIFFRDTKGFTVFAENEWFLQLILTITLYISNDRKDSTSYITSNSNALNYYDSNYISNLILCEPLETKNKYDFLIHKQYNNPEQIKKLKKQNANSILKIFFLTIVFFSVIFTVLFSNSISHFNELKDNTYHATNQLSGHHISIGMIGQSKYGIDVTYEDKYGSTCSDTIMLNRSDYDKYKNMKEFDFSVRSWYDSEEKETLYEYHVGELSLIPYLLTETDGFIFIFIIAVVFESLLFISYRKAKKDR